MASGIVRKLVPFENLFSGSVGGGTDLTSTLVCDSFIMIVSFPILRADKHKSDKEIEDYFLDLVSFINFIS